MNQYLLSVVTSDASIGQIAVLAKPMLICIFAEYLLINARRACAARVTVLGSVCLSVWSHLTSRMSNRAINEHAYLVAYERQKICGDLPETTAFKSYAAKQERKSQLLIYRLTHGQLSPLDAQRNVRSYPGIVNDIQSCPKQCLLMLLARVGARKLTAPSVQLQRGAWPNSAHAYWHTYVQ